LWRFFSTEVAAHCSSELLVGLTGWLVLDCFGNLWVDAYIIPPVWSRSGLLRMNLIKLTIL